MLHSNDIWEKCGAGEWIVVTTNIGWDKNGHAVMGAGIAKQAAERYEGLREAYGKVCMTHGPDTPVIAIDHCRLILFPTKPYNAMAPHLSWKGDSDYGLICRGVDQLMALPVRGSIRVPLLGCGHGNLSPEIVFPLLHAASTRDTRIVPVLPAPNQNQISKFFGPHRYLSNFWSSPVTLDGVEYPTVEHAFQAAKTPDLRVREVIRQQAAPGDAKKVGRGCRLRPDWELVKVFYMAQLVFQKFERHANLRRDLLATGDTHLIEGNNWGDTVWGRVGGTGQNLLGEILMLVRWYHRKRGTPT